MTLIIVLLLLGVVGLIGWAWWLDNRPVKFDPQDRTRVGLDKYGRRR